MDTETGTESTQELTGAQVPETSTPEGAQPSGETNPNPAPETPGSEPTIPYSRFAEVNRKWRETQQELAALRAPQQTQPQQGVPKQEDFSTYEEYIRADARHVAQTEAKQAFTDLQKKQQQGFQAQQDQARSTAAYTNWSKQMGELAAKDPTVNQLRPDVLGNMPTELTLMVMESKAAGPLTAHLLRNPEEVFRLSSMNPYQAAMEIGEMSAKLAGSSGQPPRKPSAQVPNLDPVGAGTKNGSIDPYATTTSVEDYLAATRPPPRRK